MINGFTCETKCENTFNINIDRFSIEYIFNCLRIKKNVVQYE